MLSNLYPPHHIGGYEIGCKDAVEGLRSRGWTVHVLTTSYGLPGPATDGHVLRWLSPFQHSRKSATGHMRLPAPLALGAREWHNQRAIRRALREFHPDVVYVWNPAQLSLAFLSLLKSAAVPTCFYVFDEWPAQMNDSWVSLGSTYPTHSLRWFVARMIQALAKAAGLATESGAERLDNMQFASAHLERVSRAAQRVGRNAAVIPWGVAPVTSGTLSAPEAPIFPAAPRLLYVGQLMPHKGIHTAVRTLAALRSRAETRHATLTLVGGTTNVVYVASLREDARRLGVSDAVEFRGELARDAIGTVYREHDVLLFPSTWDEPFGLTALEAMAAGLPVVSTGTGGNGEIVVHDQTGLIFPRENADAAAEQVLRLLSDSTLRDRLIANGRAAVASQYNLQIAIDRVAAAVADATARGV